MTCVSTVYRCKVCGRQKQQSNDWRIAMVETVDGASAIAFCTWNAGDLALVHRGEAFPVCGEECSHVLLSRWMSSGTLEPQRNPSPEEPK